MSRWYALVRPPTDAIARCRLTHLARAPIDPREALAQHAGYCAALSALGVAVHAIEALPDEPDAVFVEDPAIVLDECGILTRPSGSRAREVDSVARALERFRPTLRLPEGVELEGGDCLRVGRRLFVGLSTRSSREGLAALSALVEPLGYELRSVPVRGALHLKTACTWLEGERVLVNPEHLEVAALDGLDTLTIEPGEDFAACVVSIDGRLIAQDAFPRTNARLRAAGHEVLEIPFTELAKAEAGPTCCSLLLRGRAGAGPDPREAPARPGVLGP